MLLPSPYTPHAHTPPPHTSAPPLPTHRVYLKYHQLRISGNKAQLCERIREHIAKD